MIGATALWLMYAWLLSAIVASYLSDRKGYGEKIGLASGLLLFVLGVVIWLLWPPRPDSKWKTIGPFRRRKAEDVVEDAGEGHDPGSDVGARAASSR
jgi:hypothetical protein